METSNVCFLKCQQVVMHFVFISKITDAWIAIIKIYLKMDYVNLNDYNWVVIFKTLLYIINAYIA